MKKIELKQYIKECINEVLEEDQAFGESAIHENTLLERWEKIGESGPADRHRRSSGEHLQDDPAGGISQDLTTIPLKDRNKEMAFNHVPKNRLIRHKNTKPSKTQYDRAYYKVHKSKELDEKKGPARIARQTSGVHSQDQGRDPLAKPNSGSNRLAWPSAAASDKITSYQRKSGKTASRDKRVPFKQRPKVGSFKKIGEETIKISKPIPSKIAKGKYPEEWHEPKRNGKSVTMKDIKKLGEYRTNISGGRGDVPPPNGPVKRSNISGGYGGKTWNSKPPRTGLKPKPDDQFAVKKNSPMGAIEKVRRKLTGKS